MKYKLMNARLLVLAYLRSLYKGPAQNVPQTVHAILVIQTAKLGDMVCSTPVFHALREKYPTARIGVLGDSVGEKVLENNKDIDFYIRDIKDARILARELKKHCFGASIVLVPDSKGIAASYLAGIPFVAAPKIENGYCPWQTKTYRALLRLVHTEPHRMGHYAPREYLRLLEPLGIRSDDTTKHLGYSQNAAQMVEVFLKNHQLIGGQYAIISPSAGNKIKNWPADRFARVAEHLVGKGLPVVVIGSERDREEVDAVVAALEEPLGIINAIGQFSIDELKAFIARAAIFVSVDTGPIYIAEALGVPTVDIVGPMDENEQPPRGDKHIVVVPERASPELHIMNAREYDSKEARKQAEAISAQEVERKIDMLLQL